MASTERKRPLYPEKHRDYTLSNRSSSSSLRYFYSGGFFLLVVFALFSCGAEPPRGARLQLHWKGAKGDSTELFLHLTDSLGQSSVKTIWLTDASGRETLHFPLTSTTEALLYPTTGEWAFALQLAPRREVRLDLDCSSPRLHTAQGYPEADLRRKFVRQEKETLQALDRIAQRLYTEGSKLSAQEWRKATEEEQKLEQKLQTQAAHFIVANKEKLGIAALADEYFPSFEGALDFLHLYPNESLPHHLLRLNNYIAYWKSRSTDTLWRDPDLFPMPSTLRKVWEKEPSTPRYLLIAMTDSLWRNDVQRTMHKALRADSLSQSLFILAQSAPQSDSLISTNTTQQKIAWADSLALMPHYYTQHPAPLIVRHIMRHWGVLDMPYFLLISEGSRIIYRGKNLSRALDTMRKARGNS